MKILRLMLTRLLRDAVPVDGSSGPAAENDAGPAQVAEPPPAEERLPESAQDFASTPVRWGNFR